MADNDSHGKKEFNGNEEKSRKTSYLAIGIALKRTEIMTIIRTSKKLKEAIK